MQEQLQRQRQLQRQVQLQLQLRNTGISPLRPFGPSVEMTLDFGVAHVPQRLKLRGGERLMARLKPCP